MRSSDAVIKHSIKGDSRCLKQTFEEGCMKQVPSNMVSRYVALRKIP